METRFPRKLVSSGRPVVVLDLDDVLFPRSQAVIEFSRQRYGLELRLEDYVHHGLDILWGCSLEEAERREYEFLTEMAVTMPPALGVIEVLNWLKPYFDFDIITARWESLAELTVGWARGKLGDRIRDIYFVTVTRGKGDIAVDIPGVVAVADDYLKNLSRYHTALGSGVIPILFGQHPWNDSFEPPPGTRQVLDWWGLGELLWTLIGGAPLRPALLGP